MALYFNDKIIEPSNEAKATTLQKTLYAQLQEVKEMFEKFKIPGVEPTSILLTRDFKKKWNRKRTSWKPAAPVNFPLVANLYDETMGSVQLRYASSPPQRVDNRLIWSREKGVDMFFDNMTLTSNRLDLAWFFLKGTNYLEKKMYQIVDHKADFAVKYEDVMLEKSVTNLLFDESATEEQIAKVATLFFKDGQIDFKAISGKQEMSIRLYQTAGVNQKAKQKPGYAELHKICEKVGLGKNAGDPETKTTKVVLNAGTPEKVEIPLEIKPDEVDRVDLVEEAKGYEIKNPGALKNDVLYTMVKYYRERK